MTDRKKSFLRLLACAVITLQTICIPLHATNFTSTNATEPNAAAQDKAKKIIVSELLKQAIEQLESVDFILEHIGGRLNNKSIMVTDANALRQNIKQLRTMINTMRSGAYVYTSQQNLCTILHFNALLIEQINTGFDQNLATIPPLDMMKLMTRTQQQIGLQELVATLQTNTEHINLLHKRAQNFGLNFFNRTFRKVELFNKRHNVITKATKTAFVLGGLGYILYKLPDSLFDSTKKSDDPTEQSYLTMLQKAVRGQTSPEQKRKSLLTFSRVPRPADLTSGPLFAGKLGWVGKSLYSIKKRLGSAPIIKNGIITKSGTGLYGRIDTLKAGIELSAHHLGLTALAPVILPFFQKDIAKAGKILKGSWGFIRSKLRGGRAVTHAGFKKNPEVSFKDVIGNDHIKDVFAPVIEYICDPKKFDQPGIPPEKGYLLAGESRTGKTFLAEALAGEIKKRLAQLGKYNEFAFIKMPASLISEYGIDYILNLAKAAAPCVLFIDEIDLLKLQRDRDSQALSKFLTSMSGCLDNNPDNQVIIVAATNRPQHIDFALRQPGRFGKMIRFEYPPLKSRREYLKRQFDKRCLNEDMFDLDQLAYETEGSSFDAIRSIIVSAMQRAKLRHSIVSQPDFTAAIDEEVRHIFPTSRNLPQSERKSIAMYQASRAVAMHFLQATRVIVKVTRNPITADVTEESIYTKENRPQQEIKYGDVFSFLPEDALNLVDKKAKTAQIKVLIAGHVGAELMDARAHNYRMNDNQQALKLAQELILGGIVKKVDLSRAKQDEILDKAYDLVEQCREEVATLLEKHTPTLTEIGNTLVQSGSITGKQITQILEANQTSSLHTKLQQAPPKKENEEENQK